MAAKIEQDFTLRRGTGNILQFTVVDAAGAVVNIAGATAIVWTLSSRRESKQSKIQKSLGSGVALTTNGTDGQFNVTLAAADLVDLAGEYFHDAGVTLNAIPQIVAEGTVTILKSQSL